MPSRKLILSGAAVVVALSLTVASCGDRAKLPVSAGMGPAPTLPKPVKTLIPTVNVADAIGWLGSAPTPAAGLQVTAFADRSRPSALALRPAQWRRPGRRDQRAAAARGRQGPQGQDPGDAHEEGGRRRAERQPDHASARRGRRRSRRDPHRLPLRPQLAVRNGAGRRRFLRRRHRRGGPLPLSRRRDGDRRRRNAPDRPARRASATITGPRA